MTLVPEDSRLSPSGHAAAVAWEGTIGASGDEGIHLLTSSTGAGHWLAPAAASLRRCFPNGGWSGSGRYLATLCKPGDEDGSQHTGWSDNASRALGVQVFDASVSQWLPLLQVQAAGSTRESGGGMYEGGIIWGNAGSGPSFSPCETALAAVWEGVDGRDESVFCISIVGVQAPFHKALVLHDDFQLGWLQGPSLVVLDLAKCGLARIDVDTAAAGPPAGEAHEVQWVPFRAHADVTMDVLNSGFIVLLQSEPKETRSGAADMMLSVYGPDLHQRSSVAIPASRPGAAGRPAAFGVRASPRAIAAMCWHHGVRVYALDQSGVLGSLLFTSHMLFNMAFSPGGHFLAGVLHDTVYILKTSTGACLHRLQPDDYCTDDPYNKAEIVSVDSIAWAGRACEHLHVSADMRVNGRIIALLLSIVGFTTSEP